PELVVPVRPVVLHDEADLGLLQAVVVGVRRRQTAGRPYGARAARALAVGAAGRVHVRAARADRTARRGAAAAVADDALGERRGAIAGMEDRGVHRVPVAGDGERARRIAEERQDGLRRAAE